MKQELLLKKLSEQLKATYNKNNNMFFIDMPVSTLVDGEIIDVIILHECANEPEDWWNTIYVDKYAFDVNLWLDMEEYRVTIYPIINDEVDYTTYLNINLSIIE